MSTTTPNLGLFKYNPTTDSSVPFNIVTALNNNWDILDSNSGSRNIGEIVASAVPLTDAGLHLLDGTLLNGNGAYSAFVTYIAGLVSTYPNLFVTESAWQTAESTYGLCGKFVYDSVNNTVRLPHIYGFIEGTNVLSMLGNFTPAGLPNITGSLYGDTFNGSGGNPVFWGNDGGALDGFKENTSGDIASYANSATYHVRSVVRIDASRSSSIYGKSTTVQPQTIKVLYYIVIATSTKTDIQVDIDNLINAWNNRFSYNSTTQTLSIGV